MKFYLLALALLVSVNCLGQEKVRYYSQAYEGKEVTKEKAKYSQRISGNSDGSVSIDWKDLQTNKIIQSETYLDGTPYGIWFYEKPIVGNEHTVNYDFETKYSTVPCTLSHSYMLWSDTLNETGAGQFEPPQLAGGEKMLAFIRTVIGYLRQALENGTSGVAEIRGVLTKEGVLKDLSVFSAPSKVLAAESMRIVRMIAYVKPALLNGQAIDLCISMPITFRLD